MTDDHVRELRAAQNQSLFRSINENLVELNVAFEALTETATFVCECAYLRCLEQIELTMSDYARIRANPTRFLVAPSEDHVLQGVEIVVERSEAFFVVAKIGVGAEVAAHLAASG
jgi:hypothetical protein